MTAFVLPLLQVVLDQLTFGPAYNLAFMAYTAMVVHSKHQGGCVRGCVLGVLPPWQWVGSGTAS